MESVPRDQVLIFKHAGPTGYRTRSSIVASHVVVCMQDSTVGVVGLGNMGGSIARNLLDRQYPVSCYDIDEHKVAEIQDAGAVAATSPADVAAQSDVVVTSLPNPAVASDVYLGDDGILAGSAGGLTVFEMSTIGPETVTKIAEQASDRGVQLIGAPIMGGSDGAARGDMTVIVSGDPDIVQMEPVQQVIDDLATHSIYTGEIGTSHTMKLVTNFIDLANNVVAMEAASLAIASGMDETVLLDALTQLSSDGGRLEQRLSRAFERDFDKGFTNDYAMKDIGLFLEAAESETLPAYVGSVVFQLYMRARAHGLGDSDPSSIISIYEDDMGHDGRYGSFTESK